MISNRVRRNFWLVIAIMSVGVIVYRAIRFAGGSLEWWQLLSPIAVTALSAKFYFCYRRQVEQGNLYGKVDLRGCHRSGKKSF